MSEINFTPYVQRALYFIGIGARKVFWVLKLMIPLFVLWFGCYLWQCVPSWAYLPLGVSIFALFVATMIMSVCDFSHYLESMDLLKQLMGYIVGVPLLLIWTIIYVWYLRAHCFKHRVLVSISGPFWARTKTYQVISPLDEEHNYGGGIAALSTVFYVTVGFIICAAIIF